MRTRISADDVAEAFSKDLSDADKCQQRTCVGCLEHYTIAETAQSDFDRFPDPYGYLRACLTHCLDCWLRYYLDVDDRDPPRKEQLSSGEAIFNDFLGYLLPGVQIAVLPLTRVTVRELDAVKLPGPSFVYSDFVDTGLNVHLLKWKSDVDNMKGNPFDNSTVIAFPAMVNWKRWTAEPLPRNHAILIRKLSGLADRLCLDLLRYTEGDLRFVHSLPGRAGQITGNPMMSAALLLNPATREGQLFGGDSFSHTLTQGLGIELYDTTCRDFPDDGEVGGIVQHAIFLYAAALESLTSTSKFVQAMTLMEFLANPKEYSGGFKKAKTVIAGCVAQDRRDYHRILSRFRELTSIEDETKGQVGLRTRLVHSGHRLEDCLSDGGIKELFHEFDGYIRPMINDMLNNSHLDWVTFDAHRKSRRNSFIT